LKYSSTTIKGWNKGDSIIVTIEREDRRQCLKASWTLVEPVNFCPEIIQVICVVEGEVADPEEL